MYGHAVGISGAIMCWCALVKLHLPAKPALQWNAVRHMVAAAHIEYYSLYGWAGTRTAGPSSRSGTCLMRPPPAWDFCVRSGGIDTNEWETVEGRDLLSKQECDEIKTYKGFTPFLPIYWGMAEVRR